ncbi:hypothetical protein GCM10011487_13700 [Steroidobacter agaridevorans]|uniref:Uncharacterized protein n=1 Tax=Steroidobacter agaridevorans TaxID=2695856 RepID=A0A829Y865_9GAMM|nr:hypothetical protein [Steroidobacter agaridevorans]GFE79370.1 hypothetical protein GCM10011487_13700 [Steroidobacter agaridevorans]GFE88375.1 hypothetical protein GCM10011488_33290 [Steroidobacter agaridevorans]
MRDYERYDDDDDLADYAPRRRSVFDAVESVLLLGALALIAMPAIKGIARRYRVRNPIAACEDQIDESLKETFPASDAPAHRYVDIPVNRRDTTH